ncbi:WD40-repeat-containing domain protein [Cladochytrium replicatum]|nr:WD40-repeat-containing domain protein [Cladochytrium replicatum]
MFEKRAHSLPITALSFLTDSVLAVGTGPYLLVYKISSNLKSPAWTCECFEGLSNIHGIEVNYDEMRRYRCALFGGKHIELIDVVEDENHSLTGNRVGKQMILPDLIQAVKWIGEDNIGIVLGHNCLEVWNISGTNTRSYRCAEHCLLHSAECYGSSEETLLVAAGTIFREILLWRPVWGDSASTEILYRLTGHEGVIFGITFNVDGTLLSSVSEDRSIRIWNINLPKSKFQIDDVGGRPEIKQADRILYGHGARPWASVILNTTLISVAEDCTTRLWDVRTGECTKEWKDHGGKNVWCIAANLSSKLIATGGNDSSVNLKRLDTSTMDIVILSPLSIQDSVLLSWKNMKFINAKAVVLCDSSGCFSLYIRESETSDANNWMLEKNLYIDEEYADYSVIEFIPGKDILVAGSRDGSLCAFNIHSTIVPFKWRPHKGFVQGIYLFNNILDKSLDIFSYDTIASHIIWDVVTISDNCQVDVHHKALILLPENFQVTSLCLSQRRFLIIGSRTGDITSFNLHEEQLNIQPYRNLNISQQNLKENRDFKRCIKSNGLIRRAHTSTVTCIKFLSEYAANSTEIDDFQTRNKDLRIISCGRDGHFCLSDLLVDLTKGEWILQKKLSSRLSKGWLEQIIFFEKEMYFFGFFNKEFIILTQSGEKIFSVDCAGGHRRWDAHVSDQRILFAFIKKKDKVFCLETLTLKMVIQEEKSEQWSSLVSVRQTPKQSNA